MKNGKTWKKRAVLHNIFKYPLLRYLLLISLLVPILTPLRIFTSILQQFSEKLLEYSEEEA